MMFRHAILFAVWGLAVCWSHDGWLYSRVPTPQATPSQPASIQTSEVGARLAIRSVRPWFSSGKTWDSPARGGMPRSRRQLGDARYGSDEDMTSPDQDESLKLLGTTSSPAAPKMLPFAAIHRTAISRLGFDLHQYPLERGPPAMTSCSAASSRGGCSSDLSKSNLNPRVL